MKKLPILAALLILGIAGEIYIRMSKRKWEKR